jgi:hypothetical protein
MPSLHDRHLDLAFDPFSAVPRRIARPLATPFPCFDQLSLPTYTSSLHPTYHKFRCHLLIFAYPDLVSGPSVKFLSLIASTLLYLLGPYGSSSYPEYVYMDADQFRMSQAKQRQSLPITV